MPNDKGKDRRRMVVEEVGGPPPKDEAGGQTSAQEQTSVEHITPPEIAEPLEEVKEKVEELQNITEEIAESVDKSVEVQEEIVEAAEKVVNPASSPGPAVAPPPQPMMQTRMPSPMIILIPGVLILGAILGGVYFYQKNVSTALPTETPVATVEASAAPSASASATPVGKLDLTKYTVTVQNGVGIPGVAGTAKDTLTKAGFKVTTTGNADNYDYTDTVIQAKSTVPAEYITKMTTALSAKYKVGTSKTLDASAKTDVVVIIGSATP